MGRSVGKGGSDLVMFILQKLTHAQTGVRGWAGLTAGGGAWCLSDGGVSSEHLPQAPGSPLTS